MISVTRNRSVTETNLVIQNRLFLGFLPPVLLLPSINLAQDLPVVWIGVVIDGPFFGGSLRVPQLQMFQDEIRDLNRGEFDVRFPEELQFQSDFSVAGIKAGLDDLLANPSVDLILTLGPFSTAEACRRRDLLRPVIATTGFDARSQGFPVLKGGNMKTNRLEMIEIRTDLKDHPVATRGQ